MGKYEPLEKFLSKKQLLEVPMSFREIEGVIGSKLPPAALKHRAWWSNNPSNSVITYAWLRAGYKTERVDMGAQKLVFRRRAADAPSPKTSSRPAPSPGASDRTVGGVVAALRRALGGTVRVAEGFDLTQPTGETWDAE
ncbi:MAG TPA: hypothetical protein VGL58_02870 [Caulobacteraceae bacterium]|jgi:hypothetical protein